MDANEEWLELNGYKKDNSCVWLKSSEHKVEEGPRKGSRYDLREIVTKDTTSPEGGKYTCSMSIIGNTERDMDNEVKGSVVVHASSPHVFIESSKEAVEKEYALVKDMIRQIQDFIAKQESQRTGSDENEDVNTTIGNVIAWHGSVWTRNGETLFKTPFQSEDFENIEEAVEKLRDLVQHIENGAIEHVDMGKIKSNLEHIDLFVFTDTKKIFEISGNTLEELETNMLFLR